MIMENERINKPKDDQVTNRDDSITNKDGDNYLEKGDQPTTGKKAEQEPVRPVNENDTIGDRDKDRERMKHSM